MEGVGNKEFVKVCQLYNSNAPILDRLPMLNLESSHRYLHRIRAVEWRVLTADLIFPFSSFYYSLLFLLYKFFE